MPNGQRKNIRALNITKLLVAGLGLGDKALYDPYWAREKTAEHAANFMYNRERQVEHLYGMMQRPPIIVSPYDAELFGHWWYEGPWFIDYLFRKSWYDQGTISDDTLGGLFTGTNPSSAGLPSFAIKLGVQGVS